MIIANHNIVKYYVGEHRLLLGKNIYIIVLIIFGVQIYNPLLASYYTCSKMGSFKLLSFFDQD